MVSGCVGLDASAFFIQTLSIFTYTMKAFLMACPPIPVVRIALIGLGGRGMKTLERYAFIKGAEIRYLVDIDSSRLDCANQKLLQTGRPLAQKLQGENAWHEVCKKADIDLVYICTEWKSHTPIAIEAMRNGKHVAVEVPAATTISECWQLVHTAEDTQRHLFMTENCCYDLFALETIEMNHRGFFGRITHCEGAYIHHLAMAPRHGGTSDTRLNWMTHSCAIHGGNPYPTHGIGPIGQLLGFHRKDRMKSLVSITSRDVCNKLNHDVGHVNTSLIQTEKGVSILLQLDVTTPRPYNRLQTVCGTKAYVQKYPLPTFQTDSMDTAAIGDDALRHMEAFATSPAAKEWLKGHELGVPNEMNYAMDARLISCLQNGFPLDIDVYDAAEWSCIAELSKVSAEQGGNPVEVPRFY